MNARRRVINRRTSTACIAAALLMLLAACACANASNQFVILSDLHPSGGHDRPNVPEQVTKVADEVLAIKPAFVIILGDLGGESMANTTLSCDSICEMKLIDAAFRRWREAGIEIHAAVGNHDVPANKPAVAAIKRNWLASQFPPYPMNAQLDAAKNPEIWKRYCLEEQYYYSFTWRGVHFAIVNSEDIKRDPVTKAADFSPTQKQWIEDALCKHADNPSKFPTLVFLHHPEAMSGDRGLTERPLYSILAKHPGEHTVKAVFGGHYHYGHYWPPAENLGAHVYATPPTVHPFMYTEYIVATVSDSAITFEKRSVAPSSEGVKENKVVYHPIPGKFPTGAD